MRDGEHMTKQSARTRHRERSYEWLLMMMGAYYTMTDERRLELQAWEDIYVDGSGRYGTSDWPGWIEMGLPERPVYDGPESPAEKRTNVSQNLRFTVYRRDGFRCVACGSEDEPTLDHRTPVAKGGTNDPENLQVLCRPCNTSKGTKTMDEWLAMR